MMLLGHHLVVVAFVLALVATVAGWWHCRSGLGIYWRYAVWIWYAHLICVGGILAILLVLLASKNFAYHYVWAHTTTDLPLRYVLAALWEGQEGSLLVWMWWHAVIGAVLWQVGGGLRKQVLVIWGGIAVLLGSMLLGVRVGDVVIGSSPFLWLKEAIVAPIFAQDSNFVPTEGSGLSPLLQNYWMLIHPPVLFLGFALSGVPFAYALAGAWTSAYRRASAWIAPTRLGLLLAILVLGMGITMGAIWAYETLNFGGYWNWDPVENAVYVPWLLLIAGLHGVLLAKKGYYQHWAWIGAVLPFIFIAYASLLVRSGLLGDSSVHAFTNTGLAGQLWVFLLSLIAAAAWGGWRWCSTQSNRVAPLRWQQVEVWLLAGIVLIGLVCFQIIVPTSLALINKFVRLFGGAGALGTSSGSGGFLHKLSFMVCFWGIDIIHRSTVDLVEKNRQWAGFMA